MEKKLIEKSAVPCYATDASQRLRPSAFMDMAQELANRHASILGFGYEELMQSRTAWVLSRMHIRFHSFPAWRDNVTLQTWHKGPEGLIFLRDFCLTDEKDTKLIEATTSWLVLNIDTRRLVRNVDLDENTICSDNAISPSCDRIQMPKDVEPELSSVHRVVYSDIDMNGHTNNAMYLVWAMDCVDYADAVERPLKEMRINFNQETLPGDEVELYRVVVREENRLQYFVEGKVGGKSTFCVELTF